MHSGNVFNYESSILIQDRIIRLVNTIVSMIEKYYDDNDSLSKPSVI